MASSEDEHEVQPSSRRGSRKRRNRKNCIPKILDLCKSHLSVESEAEAHYRNVCRALVSETLEMSYFLEKTTTFESEHSEELKELALKDWVSCLFSDKIVKIETETYRNNIRIISTVQEIL